MDEQIYELRKELEEKISQNAPYEQIVEASQRLDKLIQAYYTKPEETL